MLKMYYNTNNIFKYTFTPSEDSGKAGQIRSQIRDWVHKEGVN